MSWKPWQPKKIHCLPSMIRSKFHTFLLWLIDHCFILDGYLEKRVVTSHVSVLDTRILRNDYSYLIFSSKNRYKYVTYYHELIYLNKVYIVLLCFLSGKEGCINPQVKYKLLQYSDYFDYIDN